MIIDAKDLILGRMSTVIAKKALEGDKVDVVNCEKAVVSGSRREVIEKFKHKASRATIAKGPYVSRMPDRFVRRIIRGMLPYKFEKGRKAFERIMCHIGIPKEFEGKKFESIDNANANKRKLTKFVTVHEICREMGAKI